MPSDVHGASLLPLVQRAAREVRDELFAELTYHAAYDPMRAIRTRRHKLIRPFGDRLLPVLPNVDDSPSKDLLVAAGWAKQPRPRIERYDLLLDGPVPVPLGGVVNDPAGRSAREPCFGAVD